MKEVAAHAGVSPATVSRALSSSRAMNPEVQQRVLESASALGYQVNLLGRALRQQRLDVIGLIVPDLENPFFAALAEQLGRTLLAGGYELLVSSAGGDLTVEEGRVRSFLGQQIHALVVIPCDERGSAAALESARNRVPVVQFDRRVTGAQVPFVGCDNVKGIELIIAHISDTRAAHEDVVFVAAGRQSSSGQERESAFSAAFPGARVLHGSFDAAWGYRAVDLIVQRGIRSGTIVAAADVIAIGVVAGLQASGFRVPEDFRVIGFDGIGVTGFALPSLTTVRQPVEAMSETILEIISGRNDHVPEYSMLEPRLVIGSSSPAESVNEGAA